VVVSPAVADESDALESAAADFFFLDFLVEVLEAELSSAVPASFLAFLDFFLVVVVSVLWSLEVACGLASAGIDTASNRHRAAIQDVNFMGSLLIWVLCLRALERPQVVERRCGCSQLTLGWDA
jgi:hypothetical protein